MTRTVLCVDVGSTFTKAALIALPGAELLGTAEHPTTLDTDVLDGIAAVRDRLERAAGRRPDEVRACSSAGGGLRIAVIGYERLVTAEAGRQAALSAGGRVVHVQAGPVDAAALDGLRAARPDVLLLVGGTDGGNHEVLLHNAARLAAARLPVPIVLAGNADRAEQAAALLARTRRRVVVAPNVLPRIGVLEPGGARQAIREVFLRHVIGGKGLSRGPRFARMVRAATPDAMLAGVEVLADGCPPCGLPGAGDVLVVDVGGATTDVYSVLADPEGQREQGRPGRPQRAAGTPSRARTVEGDLGVRWSAPGVVDAALAHRLLAEAEADPLRRYADRVAARPDWLPGADADLAAVDRDSGADVDADLLLARLAVTVALRRHGRPGAGEQPRPLRSVCLVVGSGGALRHAGPRGLTGVLRPALQDHAGGWPVPEQARVAVDARYVLFAAGLLAADEPAAAAALVSRELALPPPSAG